MLLIIERPNERPQTVHWDDEAVERFNLDHFEIEDLDRGDTIWRGDTAFSLEREADANA